MGSLSGARSTTTRTVLPSTTPASSTRATTRRASASRRLQTRPRRPSAKPLLSRPCRRSRPWQTSAGSSCARPQTLMRWTASRCPRCSAATSSTRSSARPQSASPSRQEKQTPQHSSAQQQRGILSSFKKNLCLLLCVCVCAYVHQQCLFNHVLCLNVLFLITAVVLCVNDLPSPLCLFAIVLITPSLHMACK